MYILILKIYKHDNILITKDARDYDKPKQGIFTLLFYNRPTQ